MQNSIKNSKKKKIPWKQEKKEVWSIKGQAYKLNI